MSDLLNKAEEFLIAITNRDLSVIADKAAGLCYNLDAFIGGNIKLKPTFESWEHYSDNISMPVPPSEDFDGDACDYYMHTCNLYIGHQLEMRQSLTQHILDNINLVEIESCQ